MKTNLKDKLFAGIMVAAAATIILLTTGGKFISFNSRPEIQTDTSVILPFENPSTSVVISPDPVDMPVIQSIPDPVVNVTLTENVTPAPAPFPVIPEGDTTLKIKDNVVQRTFSRDGKKMDMKLKIEKGEVSELTIDGKEIPEKDWGKYQDEIDETLADVRQMEEDLTRANENLDRMDMEKLRMEIEKSVQEIQEKIEDIDFDAMVQKLEDIKIPEIDKEKLEQEIEKAMKEIQEIDFEKIQSELEFKMQALCEEMKEIELPDKEQLKQEMEKARQVVEHIDQEKIRAEVQEAMKEIQIDKEELQREIEKSMQELKEVDVNKISKELENEKMKMDEMLKEIEKLELDKK